MNLRCIKIEMKKVVSLICLTLCCSLYAQQSIDKVIAVVGNSIILESDIQGQVQQLGASGEVVTKETACLILEDLLYQKLLVAQANRDSITVTDAQVDEEMDRKMRFYIRQHGSQEAFEKFYGKSVESYKNELRDKVRDNLLSQTMQGRITGSVKVTPAEVRDFFNSIPKDSLPLINSELEIGHIVMKPAMNPELKEYARQKLSKVRQEILDGKLEWCSAAGSVSEDPGSYSKCGEYKDIQRGQFVPEFDAVVFRIKPGEISEVFETDFGFHIAQLIERRGEEVDVRHILVSIPSNPDDLLKAKDRLDSVRAAIMMDSISFADAAAKFSDDKETRNSGGLLVNPQTGATRFEMDLLGQVDPGIVFYIDKMKVGEISPVLPYKTRDNKDANRIIWLKSRTEPHVVNLEQDYQRIQEQALMKKQQEEVNKWVASKLEGVHIRIVDEYKYCKFANNWLGSKPN